jgi:hypothetical protein
MFDSRQKAALTLSATLPLGALGLFLGAERPANADSTCGPSQCYAPNFHTCVAVGWGTTINGVSAICRMSFGSAQWSGS